MNKTGKRNKQRQLKNIIKNRHLIYMVLPAMLFLLVFRYFPMYGTIIAFKDFDVFQGITASPWVGLKYFKQFLYDDYLWRVIVNTIYIYFYKCTIVFAVPIIMAIFLNEIVIKKFKRFTQTVIYLPHFLSWVIVGSIITQFLSPQSGVINNIIQYFGGNPIPFLNKAEYFRGIIVFQEIWRDAGYFTIIYITAMTSINPHLYEAATVDGASKLKQIWHITLPGIRPTIIAMFTVKLASLNNYSEMFNQVYPLLNSLVYETGDIIDTYVYRTGVQQANFSYATAVGLFKGIIGAAIVIASNKATKKKFGGDALL